MRLLIATILLLQLLLSGCGHRESTPEKRFDFTGRVVSVDRKDGVATIAHEEIPGYMSAMTMPFKVKEEWALKVLAPGQRIRGTLVVRGLDSWLEGLTITQSPSPADVGAAEGSNDPKAGVEVPDFPLVNQDGKRVHLRGYGGRYLLLTFIYTRCPLPDYCPRMSTYFSEILQAVEKDPAMSERVHLMSVSFDPEFDRPNVLRDYGRAWLGSRGEAGFRAWEFATGTEEEVRQITQFFGLSYWRETGQIIHSLRTALVGPDGKLVELYRGNEWKPSELVARVRALVKSR
jgi:protein SCO1